MPTATRPALDDLPTEQRLLHVAERLFAERGVEAVSLRAIMQAAGTNVAAVHYHFGSKDALLDAVVRSRLDRVAFDRDSLVAGLDESANPRALAAVFIQPILDLADRGGADWVRIIAELLRANHPALAPVSDGFFNRHARFYELLQAADARASKETISFRLLSAMSLTLSTLGHVESVRSTLAREGSAWTDDDVRDQLVDLVASILVGPTRPAPEGN